MEKSFSVVALILILLAKVLIHALQAKVQNQTGRPPPKLEKHSSPIVEILWIIFFLSMSIILAIGAEGEGRILFASCVMFAYAIYSGVRLYLKKKAKKRLQKLRD